ncbi:MAG: isoaspartyl peptidase/L-asparaginase family protein [Dissulfurispiraceae bacterium]
MIVAIHGGAGDRKPTKKHLKILGFALESGYKKLLEGAKAVDAVVAAISVLEDSGIFNAGAGGVLQMDGVRRLDASLMDGSDLKAGSVVGLEGILNPIKVARIVMDLPHVMLTNLGAQRIALSHHLVPLKMPSAEEIAKLEKIVKTDTQARELYARYFSTVGAVARDCEGNVAAGASTGGVRAMLPGRVGDTPIIGAGVYAETSLGAVSCTGTGEHIIRISLAKELCMNIMNMPSRVAARRSLQRIVSIGGSAGIILILDKGGAVIMHTTKYMASGYIDKRGCNVSVGASPLNHYR